MDYYEFICFQSPEFTTIIVNIVFKVDSPQSNSNRLFIMLSYKQNNRRKLCIHRKQKLLLICYFLLCCSLSIKQSEVSTTMGDCPVTRNPYAFAENTVHSHSTADSRDNLNLNYFMWFFVSVCTSYHFRCAQM